MISTCISAGLFLIIGLTINANFWYWLLLGLYFVVKILKCVCDILEEKCDKNINKSIMEFCDEVIEHNERIIELSEHINTLNGDVLSDNKTLIDELKRRNKNE